MLEIVPSYLESALAFFEIFTINFINIDTLAIEFKAFMDPLEQFRITFTTYNYFDPIVSYDWRHFYERVLFYIPPKYYFIVKFFWQLSSEEFYDLLFIWVIVTISLVTFPNRRPNEPVNPFVVVFLIALYLVVVAPFLLWAFKTPVQLDLPPLTFLLLFFYLFFTLFFATRHLWANSSALAMSYKRLWTFYVTSFLFYQIKNLLADNIRNLKSLIVFPWFFILFIFILFSNLFGLIPFSYTVTSTLITTFYLSISYFISINIIGITLHKDNFTQVFSPEGIPLAITPFLLLVEIISYFARVASIAIRLFANLMSGHTLLHILMGAAWGMLSIEIPYIFSLILPAIIIFLISALEFLIGAMQAFVFVILMSIYFNDLLVLH